MLDDAQLDGDTLSAESQPDLNSTDTTPGKVNAAVSVQLTMPDRPAPDAAVSKFVRDLWKETTELPAFEEAVKAARESQKTLFPAWHDKSDKWLGKVPMEKRTRKEDRLVRTPHIYLNQRHAIAQTAPEDHAAVWKPREQVKPRESDEIVASSAEERFADTIRVGTREYLSEAGLQAWFEAFVQDCKSFPIGVLKLTFQADWNLDALNGTTSNDEQDSVERLRVLAEEFARGNITQEDGRFLEMVQLVQTLGGKTELQVWRRFRLQVVPINAFRAPDSCRDPLLIYEQPWLADDQEMSAEEIRTKYRFARKKDDQGNETEEWTGVHPEDLEIASGAAGERASKHDANLRRRSSRRGAGSSARQVKSTLIVREVWHRLTNTVYTLVEGVPYPVAKWVPERQHDKWYPYVVVVPNRIANDLYGISDVELQADIQHRLNRKATDQEKARWLSMPRDFYDSSIGDAAAIQSALTESKPGKPSGIPLSGKKIEDVLHRLEWAYPRDAFESGTDREDLRLAARIPEQAQGVVGRAKFAEEVKTANEGNQVATNFDQNIYKRALVDIYDRAAQMMIWELDEDDWRDVAGEYALIPSMVSEEEARAARQAIRQEALQQAMLTVQRSAGMDPEVMTPWGVPDPMAMQRKAKILAGEYERKLCEMRYGPEGLISREGLYRRLRCQVDISVNGSLDREQRMASLMRICVSMESAASAAKDAGLRFNPKPWLRRWAELSGEQTALDAMFEDDPTALATTLVGLIAQGKSLDPKLAMVLEQILMPIVQQQLAAQPPGGGAPDQGGGPPAPAGQGAPPPPLAPPGPMSAPGATQPPDALAAPPTMPG